MGKLHRLSAKGVEAALGKPGRHSDGGNLYLEVDTAGRRRWIFRYRVHGKRRDMGLGSAADVTLADARKLAGAARAALDARRDPLTRTVEKVMAPTFGVFAEEVISSLEQGFRNEKHRAQWRSTLKQYASKLAKMPVDAIATADVLAVLKPIWQRIPETASRVRGRIEKILDAAKAAGHRTGENPAAWKGNLAHLLSARQKLTRGHFAAMDFADMSAFMKRLRAMEALAPRALEFAILTAARSGEVRGASWNEIDLIAKVWTIPAQRMKMGREHRVPLTAGALSILAALLPLKSSDRDLIFPGRYGQPLSDMTLDAVLRRLKAKPVTVHGFRSAFRDWAGEETSFAREVAELALAHSIGDATEQAYRRGDALEKRRDLMAAWARHCDPERADNVVSLRAVV